MTKQIIYVIFTEKFGEMNAVFNEKEELIGYWSCNDASWRGEYFSGFLEKLGIEEVDPSKKQVKKFLETLRARLIEDYGYDPSEE